MKSGVEYLRTMRRQRDGTKKAADQGYMRAPEILDELTGER
jgi:hypothetical protein